MRSGGGRLPGDRGCLPWVATAVAVGMPGHLDQPSAFPTASPLLGGAISCVYAKGFLYPFGPGGSDFLINPQRLPQTVESVLDVAGPQMALPDSVKRVRLV